MYKYDILPLGIVILSWTALIFLHTNSQTETKTDTNTNATAFATLVTPAFAMGAVALGHSLRKLHGNRHDLVCLISPDVNETWKEILEQWWTVKPVPEYKPTSRSRRSWTKLRLWTLTEYKKIVYLDSDTLVMKPIDDLFTYPQLSCACDPDPPQICNTGLMVLEPKDGLFEAMDKMARVDKVRMGIGDQSSINAFFHGFTPIPPSYNVPRVAGSGLGDLLKRDAVHVVHFVCKKPWKCGREGVSYCGCAYPKLNELWWKTWDEACKGHLCMESWEEPKK